MPLPLNRQVAAAVELGAGGHNGVAVRRVAMTTTTTTTTTTMTTLTTLRTANEIAKLPLAEPNF